MYIYSKLIRELMDLAMLYGQACEDASKPLWCIRAPVGILRIVFDGQKITDAMPAVLSACTLMTQEQAESVAQALKGAGLGECVALPWKIAIAAQYADVQQQARDIEREVRFGNERYSQAVRYYWDLTREFRSGYDCYKHPGMAQVRYVKRRSK
ncbi:hypothetical protein [Achromobacter phage shaaii_LB5]|nr:hypothetical protein [Achromobacter phage shaaii_LB5]